MMYWMVASVLRCLQRYSGTVVAREFWVVVVVVVTMVLL